MNISFVIAAAIVACVSGVAQVSAQPPEDESDPQWRYVSAAIGIQAADDFVVAARDACAAVAPKLTEKNATAYANWHTENADAFAELPTELDRAFAIIAEKDGITVEQVLSSLSARREETDLTALAHLSSLPKADADAQCATFTKLLNKMSLKGNSDLRVELARLQEARAQLYGDETP